MGFVRSDSGPRAPGSMDHNAGDSTPTGLSACDAVENDVFSSVKAPPGERS